MPVDKVAAKIKVKKNNYELKKFNLAEIEAWGSEPGTKAV